MKYQVYVLKDLAADVFGQPMFALSKGGQVRSFGDEINRPDEKNMLYMHPEDFDLYVCGEYNDYGAIFECEAPQLVVRGRDLKQRKE